MTRHCLEHLLDGEAVRLHGDVGIPVGGGPLEKQGTGVLVPQGSRRVLGNPAGQGLEGRLEVYDVPAGLHDGTVQRVRRKAAPRGHDRAGCRGADIVQGLALHEPEGTLPGTGEDVPHRGSGACTDVLVEVDEGPAEPVRERPAHGGLPGAHEPGEEDHSVSQYLRCSMKADWRADMLGCVNPARMAPDTAMAPMASPTTEAAGTAHTSDRS